MLGWAKRTGQQATAWAICVVLAITLAVFAVFFVAVQINGFSTLSETALELFMLSFLALVLVSRLLKCPQCACRPIIFLAKTVHHDKYFDTIFTFEKCPKCGT